MKERKPLADGGDHPVGTTQKNDSSENKRKEIKKKYLIMKLAILVTAMALLLFTISYTTLYALKKKRPAKRSVDSWNNSMTENATMMSERLMRSSQGAQANQVIVEKQQLEQISPRPFFNRMRGEQPSQFAQNYEQIRSISLTPDAGRVPPRTVNSNANRNNRLSNHNPIYSGNPPNNIQDIIQYISDNAHRHKDLPKEKFAGGNIQDASETYASLSRVKFPASAFGIHQHYQDEDPFFAYKPQDPSDINLLAPTSFRFAPSILASQKPPRRPPPPYNFAESTNLVGQLEPINELPPDVKPSVKPISLTLNIYPSENPDGSIDLASFQGPGLTPRYRYPRGDGSNLRVKSAPNMHTRRTGKMVLHLNIYPGPGGKFFRAGEEEREVGLQLV